MSLREIGLALIACGLTCLVTASAFYRAGREDAMREFEQWSKRRRSA